MPPINNMAESHCITAHTVWAMIPFAKLMRCLHTLIYMEMVIICKEIYQNLSAFSSPFGTGLALFLGIVMSKALYLQHFNNPFQQPLTQASTLMTFPPMPLPNNAANSLSTTKWQNRSTTPSRRSHSASRTNSIRQSMRTALLRLTIPTSDSPMSTPVSYTSTLTNGGGESKKLQCHHGPLQTIGCLQKKQEQCWAFAADAGNTISMTDMVQMGVMHAMETGVMCK